MNDKQNRRYTHIAAPLALITTLTLAGCALKGPSEEVLQREAQHIKDTFYYWTKQPVEKFLNAHPNPVETLDIGGGKVRYSIDYTPQFNNYGKSRYYLLYFYVSEKGIIYHTDHSQEYRPPVDEVKYKRFNPVGTYGRD